MQAVAHLMAAAVKADVFQRTAAQVRIDPKGKNPLVGLAELSRTGQDAAAVDPYGKMECIGVFQGNDFTRQFAGAV